MPFIGVFQAVLKADGKQRGSSPCVESLFALCGGYPAPSLRLRAARVILKILSLNP